MTDADRIAQLELQVAQLTGDVGAKEWALANTQAQLAAAEARCEEYASALRDIAKASICQETSAQYANKVLGRYIEGPSLIDRLTRLDAAVRWIIPAIEDALASYRSRPREVGTPEGNVMVEWYTSVEGLRELQALYSEGKGNTPHHADSVSQQNHQPDIGQSQHALADTEQM